MPVEKLQLDRMYPIVANDAIEYARSVILYVGLAGDLRVLTANGDDVTFTNIPAGYFLPVHVKKVFSTGTTAGQFLATDFDGDVLDYFSTLPSWVTGKYSLAFDAEGAEELGDYEAGTLYFRDAAFGRVPATFSRTTTATRVNKQGLIESVAANVPRIDYTDGSAKLLMEPSRTNLLSRSQEINLFPWGKNRISDFGSGSVANTTATTDPFGTNLAEYVQASSSTRPQIVTPFSWALNTYTLSLFAKKAEAPFLRLLCETRTAAGNLPTAWFDLQDGIVGTAKFCTSQMVDYGNGWYRCSITFTVNDATPISSTYVSLELANSDNTNNATSGDGMYMFGAQLEVGSYPSSYIPTAGSTVTRNFDNCQQTGLSSYIGQTEGVLFTAGSDFKPSQELISINRSTVNAVFIRTTTTTMGYFAYSDGGTYSLTGGILNGIQRTAAAYANANLRYTVNGGSIQSITSNTWTPNVVMDSLHINVGGYVGSKQQAFYDKIIIFPTALTDTELQQLTS